jgi:hypothetical protein
MFEPITCEVSSECMREHPAVRAWSRLGSEWTDPQSIETLKLKRKKSAVYRLAGVGPGGSSVIAKRCSRRTALIEQMIYQNCLPCLPLPVLRFYGFVEDTDNAEFCWLFLEDGTGEKYSPNNAEDRELAGQWLATVHTTAIPDILARCLPERGPDHYLELLRLIQTTVLKYLANSALPAEDLAALRAVASQCDLVDSHWPEVETFCRAIPPALVHGDLVIKNVRVRTFPDRRAFFVFDWEYAGWGVPATDLCQFTGLTISPDLNAYFACLKNIAQPIDLVNPYRLAEYGSIFRVIDDMSWEVLSMHFDAYRFLARPISCLRRYERLMAAALDAVKWT